MPTSVAGRKKSEVHRLFTRVTNAHLKGNRAACVFCGKELAANGTRMIEHIVKHCKKCDQQIKKKYSSSKPSSCSSMIDNNISAISTGSLISEDFEQLSSSLQQAVGQRATSTPIRDIVPQSAPPPPRPSKITAYMDRMSDSENVSIYFMKTFNFFCQILSSPILYLYKNVFIF